LTSENQQNELVEQIMDGLGIEGAEARAALAQTLIGTRTRKAPKTKPKPEPDVRLAKRVKSSERLAKAAIAKIEILACAIGACPACWGDDPDCKDCEGEGIPGSFLPDPDCFQTYVVPVLNRLDQEQFRESGEPPRTALSDASVSYYQPPTRENIDHE
jgi:hypothetical protein